MLHPKTEREIEGLLRMLDQRGEEYLYGYVKNVYLAPLPDSGFQETASEEKTKTGIKVPRFRK